jgi:hypothetical protein
MPNKRTRQAPVVATNSPAENGTSLNDGKDVEKKKLQIDYYDSSDEEVTIKKEFKHVEF